MPTKDSGVTSFVDQLRGEELHVVHIGSIRDDIADRASRLLFGNRSEGELVHDGAPQRTGLQHVARDLGLRRVTVYEALESSSRHGREPVVEIAFAGRETEIAGPFDQARCFLPVRFARYSFDHCFSLLVTGPRS